MEIPDPFVLGTATAAYQIEGAWNEDGKGPSIWDSFCRRKGKISDGRNGNEAVDHYHRYREDVALMKELGAGAYRFSISWPRILPEGTGRVNQHGLDFYDRLVDELLENDIDPYVTLFHWDLPQALQDRGGFRVRESADWFADYARTVVDHLGDRVRRWLTINEPWIHSLLGYLLGWHAPGIRNPLTFMRVCDHLLLAHGKGYDAIKASRPDSEVGIALHMYPVSSLTDSARDREAASRADQFIRGLFLDPLFKGSRPERFWERMWLFSPRTRSRDLDSVKGKVDWIGVNHYTRILASYRWYVPFLHFWLNENLPEAVSRSRAHRRTQFTSMGWEVYPRGMYEVLTLFRDTYGNPPVYITENGAAFEDVVEDGSVHDARRIEYLHSYLEMALKAREEGADVRGLFVWTLMDNFEWAFGFKKRFGLIHVDFDTQQRVVKDSGYWFSDLARTRRLRLTAS